MPHRQKTLESTGIPPTLSAASVLTANCILYDTRLEDWWSRTTLASGLAHADGPIRRGEDVPVPSSGAEKKVDRCSTFYARRACPRTQTLGLQASRSSGVIYMLYI